MKKKILFFALIMMAVFISLPTISKCITDSNPGPISGPSTICLPQTGVGYSVSPVPGVSFEWMASPGITITSGQGTNHITVDFSPGARSVFLVVYIYSGAGVELTSELQINCYEHPAVMLFGNTSVTAGSTGNIYTTDAGMSNYTWNVSSGGTITSGGGQYNNTVTVTWNTAGPATVSVNYTEDNGCAALIPKVLNVTVNAAPVFAVSGSITKVSCHGCSNGAVNISMYAGTSPYTFQWSNSASTEDIGGLAAGTYSVTVTDADSRIATGSWELTDPTQYEPYAPRPYMTGVGTVCLPSMNVGYSLEVSPYVTSYGWLLPPGASLASGSGTSSVKVNFPNGSQSGYIIGYWVTDAGCGQPKIFPVNCFEKPVPALTGPGSVCGIPSPGNVYTTEPHMYAYTWNVSAGGTITAGSTTNSITVTWNASGSKTVSVNYTDNNGCVAAVATSKTVDVFALPVPTINGPVSICGIPSAGNHYITEAGMSDYTWTVSPGGTITSGSATNDITVTWSTTGVKTIIVSYSDGNSCKNADTIAIMVNPLTIVDAGSYGPFCSDAADISLTGSPAGGVWTGTGVSGDQNSGYVFDPSAGTQTLTYTFTDANSCVNTDMTTITVYPASVGGTVSGGAPVCSGSNSGLLSLSGQTGTVLRWQSAVLVSGIWTWSNISNTYTTYTSGTLTQNTRFRAVVKSGSCAAASSAITLVTVNPATVGGSVASDQTICSGTLPASLTLSGNTGSVIRWEKSPDASFTTPTVIAGTSTILTGATIGSLTSSTYFRAVVKSGACPEISSSYVLVTVNTPTVGGSVSGGTPVCSGSNSGLLTLTGQTGNVIKWQNSVYPYSTWTDIANTATLYTSGALTENTRFRAVIQSGVCAVVNSGFTLVTVNSSTAGGTVASDQTICSGTTPASLTLSGNTGSVIRWEKSPDAGFTTPIIIAGTSTILTGAVIGNLTSNTYFRAVVKSGVCPETNSSGILVTVDQPSAGGAVSGGTPVCAGSTSGLLTLTGNSGTVVKWQNSVYPYSTWTDIANTSTIYTSLALTENTRFRAVVQSGVCPVANSTNKLITVKPNPTFTSGSITSPNCYGDDITFSAYGLLPDVNNTFNYKVTFGSDVITGSKNALSNSSGVATFVGNGYDPGSYAFEITSVTVNGCTSNYTGMTDGFEIVPVSNGGNISGSSPVTYGSSSGTMTLSGYVGTILKWQKKLNAGSWIDISNTSDTYTETPNAAGTWNYRAIVKSGVCPEVPSSEFDLTVTPKPLSITADNQVKTYDGLVYSPFTVSYNGFVLGDTYLSLGGTLTFSGSAVSNTDVGSYTIIPSGQTSTNYIITYHNGTLNINCAPVVTVRNNLNIGYGSLRNGMANVCDNGTVVFASGTDGQNIALTTGTIPVSKNVTFDNCAHTTGITISGSGDNFTVNAGKSLTLSGCSKFTVTGNIRNNAGVGGVVLASGSSFIYNSCGLQATAKRDLNNGWHLLGSPFQPNTGATRANLVPSGGSLEMKPYTNGTGWGANITSSLFMLQPLIGYAVKPSLNFTATLTGTLFCSSAISQPACEQTLSLVYNGTGTNQSWNLIANPYTSFLNWNLMGKTNVSTTLYLWDNSLYPTSPPVTTASYFRTYNSASNIGVPSGTKPFIAPMQGFFVKANSANPRLTFPLSALTHSSSAFYKEGSLTEILVRLRAENVMGTDELVVCRNPEAKNDFEEFDSEKMFDGQALEMYSQSAGGEKLVINTINSTNTIIPLGLTGNTGAKTRITAYDLESREQVYLEDRYKGKLISLSENTVYDFEFPTEMITGRFFLRFGNINTPLTTSDVKVYENNSQLNIIAQTGEDIKGVEVYTLTGACVYKVKAGNGNMFTGTQDLVPAMYLVRVQTSIATQNVKIIWK